MTDCRTAQESPRSIQRVRTGRDNTWPPQSNQKHQSGPDLKGKHNKSVHLLYLFMQIMKAKVSQYYDHGSLPQQGSAFFNITAKRTAKC